MPKGSQFWYFKEKALKDRYQGAKDALYWSRSCSICGDKPLWYWRGKTFCRAHKAAAWAWCEKHPDDIDRLAWHVRSGPRTPQHLPIRVATRLGSKGGKRHV